MMKRVVLLLLVLIVAVMAQQSSPVPTEAPQPTTSSPQSGDNPMAWDNITPSTSAPATPGAGTEDPFASEVPTPPTSAPTTSAPPPTTSAPPPSTSAPPPQTSAPPPQTSAPPPPQTSAPPASKCPPVICPPVTPGCKLVSSMTVGIFPNEPPCPACPYCRDAPCTRLFCTNFPQLATCKQLIVNQTLNGNTLCSNCPSCWDCPAPTGCEPVPTDCVNKGIATFISPVGRPCEGCPICRDNECPAPERCPKLGDDCIKIEPQTYVINNLTCPDCPICKERKTCPPASNCTTIPADCLNTVIDKVTVDGMECDGCPRCTLWRCPTPTCEAIRPQCKNITNTTFVYNGQTCPGCQRCDDVCPPLPTCPAIPADCLKIEQRTRDIDGLTCPDCPVCTERPPQCPPPSNCAEVPSSCKNVTTLTFMFQGLVCPGCKQCEDCPVPANCTAIKPGCGNVTYETVTVNGKTCQGCPKCNDPTCPAIKCPCVPKGCTQVVEKWQIINGVKCPACPDTSLCNPCPAIKCAPKDNCTELKETTFEFNGKKCPGCPECIIKCPVPKCPALPSNCTQTVDTFFEFKGMKCLGCPQCKVKECPVPQCPANNSTQCLKWKTRWYTFDGRKCPGCPKCVEFPCANKCSPVAHDCNKTATIITHVGDMKCPCKICVDTPQCPNLPCHPIDRSKCKNVLPSYFNYKGMKCRGCDECVKYQCPTIKCQRIADSSKCLAVEKTTFKFHNLVCVGCDRCIPKPKCRHCKCKDKKTVTVEIPKYIVKRKYIPYYVYHDTPCNVTKKVHRFEFLQTSKRLRYINVLKYRIKQYRTLVVHFRAVLRKLVVKKTITVEAYLNISKVIKQMRHEMENQVRLGSVRLETIEKEMKRVRFLLKKLGERSFSPVSICKRVANKRICGLHPNYFYFNWQVKQGDNAPAPTYKKNFIKHYLWSTVVFTAEPSAVVKINKVNRKKGVVVFTRRSQRWSKRVVKVNGIVRNYIWARIIARLYGRSVRARRLIRKYLGVLNGRKLSKEVAAILADSRKKSVIRHLKKHLKKRYNRKIYKVIRKQLKSKAVKALVAKHASTVSVKSYPAKEDQEMMRLPKSIINADGNTLIQLLSAKFKFE